ncbi:MAG: hypothetical protein QM504_08455 [Pseudomonadota bacterium]
MLTLIDHSNNKGAFIEKTIDDFLSLTPKFIDFKVGYDRITCTVKKVKLDVIFTDKFYYIYYEVNNAKSVKEFKTIDDLAVKFNTMVVKILKSGVDISIYDITRYLKD